MLQTDFPGLNAFADEVVVHFDMFSSGVKHGVASEVDTAQIVAEDANVIRTGNAQVLHDALCKEWHTEVVGKRT